MPTAHRQRGQVHGYRYLGTEGYTPDFTPRVDNLAVACPMCASAVGVHCVNAAGETITHTHKSRNRMARRAFNRRAAAGLSDRAYVRTILPAERRRVRESAGLTQSALADLVGAHRTSLANLENGDTQPTTEWSTRYGAWLRKQMTMAEGSTFTEALAGEIRAKMGRRNVTVSSLSASTGIPNSTLARKIAGGAPFTTVELETISGVLDTSIQALILSVRVTA